ncbi:hypothetical protein SB759_40555, partial [Pseudomonas sp. SIMBA_059]
MSDIQKQVQMINQGIMRMQMLSMASTVAFAGLFAVLWKTALETTNLGDAVDRFTSTWGQAIQPFIQSFGNVMSVIVD